MSALGKGTYVLIQSPGHRKHMRLGIIVTEKPGEFMGTWLVDVDGVEYGFLPHELTALVPVEP